MESREIYDNLKKELKSLKNELNNINVKCNDRLTKIELLNVEKNLKNVK